MLQKKDSADSAPLAFPLIRVLHICLLCYALAIICISYGIYNDETWLNPERIFAFAVGLPIVAGSGFCLVSLAAKRFFGTAVFFCLLLALVLAALPLMVNIFFPLHFLVFFLAGIYAFSAIIVIRFCFAQPLPKKR